MNRPRSRSAEEGIVAKSWREVRAQRSDLDQDKVAERTEELLDRVRAYRLVEVRKSQGLTQTDVADAMHVGQSRISKLERGDLDTAGVRTLRDYVHALGGELEVVATFGEKRLVVG